MIALQSSHDSARLRRIELLDHACFGSTTRFGRSDLARAAAWAVAAVVDDRTGPLPFYVYQGEQEAELT